ncbi:MAG: hypothetical protein WCT12_19460 [Verrucomicrobiota bacterium]
MIDIYVANEITFDLPEGNFAGKIDSVKVFPKNSRKGMEDWIRILFLVEVPGMENLHTMAGRNFKLNLHSGSELRNFLRGLLGGQFFLNVSGQKFDLESLIGRDCAVKLEHYRGKNYDKPMVVVASISPPFSMEVTQAISARGEN